MNNFRIFIAENDKIFGRSLAYHLSLNPDFSVTRFHTGTELLLNLDKKPSAIIINYELPDINGASLLHKIKLLNTTTPVIIISEQKKPKSIIKEAYKFILIDDNIRKELWDLLQTIKQDLPEINNQDTPKTIKPLPSSNSQVYNFGKEIKGQSTAIKDIFKLIEKAITNNITVSITGETGTGKELVAMAIHNNSSRNNKPFVAINVTAIPRELIESELFGHEKGSFTGANEQRIGQFERANGGTIFLDEIGEMSLSMQSKLLRVLQEREIIRVGSNVKIKIDIRLLVATHRNLMEEVQRKNFREDLYYRLLGLPIRIPPLREREGDILYLAKYFVDKFCSENNMESKKISNKAKIKLSKHHFPGNIRELKATMDLSVVLANSGFIEEDNIDIHSSSGPNDLLTSKEITLQEYKTQIINFYLHKYNNNINKVAKILNVGRSSLYRMIKNKELE